MTRSTLKSRRHQPPILLKLELVMSTRPNCVLPFISSPLTSLTSVKRGGHVSFACKRVIVDWEVHQNVGRTRLHADIVSESEFHSF
jgi:hypothetical protein